MFVLLKLFEGEKNENNIIITIFVNKIIIMIYVKKNNYNFGVILFIRF